MSGKVKEQVIAHSALGVDLEPDEVQALGKLMEVRELADGDVLVSQGEIDHALHLLATGELDVSKIGDRGADVHLHTMSEGELAGAMGFVDGIPRSATLRANGPAVVYALERTAFETLIDAHPRLVYHIMRAVTRSAHGAMLGLNSQIEELTNYIVKQHGRY